jgi:flagellar basal-body rod protein FlgF
MLADVVWERALSQNVANLATPGYKADQAAVADFGQRLLLRWGDGTPVGALDAGTAVAALLPQMGPGPLQATGRSLDVAPYGGAWLVVQTPAGVRYTQDGSLTLSPQGILTTLAGDPVLTAAGTPVRVPAGVALTIAADGTLTAGGRVLGRLALTVFARPQRLVAQGGGLYAAPAAAGAAPAPPPPTAGVLQGYLEGSNVSMAEETAQLIQVQASFSADQSAAQTEQRTFDQLLQNLGR